MKQPKHSIYHGMPVSIIEFDDVSEFVTATQTTPRHKTKLWDMAFCGNMTAAQACSTARLGDEKLATRAKALTATLGVELDMPAPHWMPAVAGAFPNVPAFLAGEHESMLALADDTDDKTPVRIWASITSSYDVEPAALEKRGAAILALVMLLIRTRPVELFIYHEGDGDRKMKSWATPIIRVNTAPLHLGQAAFMLCSQGFSRGLIYTYCSETKGMGTNGRWMFGQPDSKRRIAITRDILGAAPSDLIIPGAYSNDYSTTNPEGWLRDHVANFTASL